MSVRPPTATTPAMPAGPLSSAGAKGKGPHRRVLAGLVALALLGAACADLEASAAPTDPADGAAIAETTAPADDSGPAGALLGDGPSGDLLVGPDGRSLYAFTNDTQAISTCYGTCAEDWPPVIVGPDWTVGPRLDSGIFATTVRDDGQLQLVAGKWPLYYYAGDGAPGDINGHGAGDVWFLVDPDGSLIDLTAEEPADPPAAPDSSEVTEPDATDETPEPVAEGY